MPSLELKKEEVNSFQQGAQPHFYSNAIHDAPSDKFPALYTGMGSPTTWSMKLSDLMLCDFSCEAVSKVLCLGVMGRQQLRRTQKSGSLQLLVAINLSHLMSCICGYLSELLNTILVTY